jgi:hypothetical protein
MTEAMSGERLSQHRPADTSRARQSRYREHVGGAARQDEDAERNKDPVERSRPSVCGREETGKAGMV